MSSKSEMPPTSAASEATDLGSAPPGADPQPASPDSGEPGGALGPDVELVEEASQPRDGSPAMTKNGIEPIKPIVVRAVPLPTGGRAVSLSRDAQSAPTEQPSPDETESPETLQRAGAAAELGLGEPAGPGFGWGEEQESSTLARPQVLARSDFGRIPEPETAPLATSERGTVEKGFDGQFVSVAAARLVNASAVATAAAISAGEAAAAIGKPASANGDTATSAASSAASSAVATAVSVTGAGLSLARIRIRRLGRFVAAGLASSAPSGTLAAVPVAVQLRRRHRRRSAAPPAEISPTRQLGRFVATGLASSAPSGTVAAVPVAVHLRRRHGRRSTTMLTETSSTVSSPVPSAPARAKARVLAASSVVRRRASATVPASETTTMPGADATDALDEAVAIANDGDAAQATSATTAASSTTGVASEPPTSSTNEASSVFTPRRSSFVEEREQPEAPNGPGADGTGDEPAIAGEGRVAVDDTTATVDIPPLAETGDSEEVPASSPAAPTLTELASTFESPTAELAPVTEPTETTSALVDSAAAPEAPPAADQPVAEVESEASEDESAPASTVVDTEYGSMREDDQPKTPTLTFDDVPVVPPLGRMGTAERSPTIDGSIPTVPGAGASAAAAAAVTETMAAVPSKSAPAATDPTPTPTAPAPSPAPTVPMRRRPRRARLKVTRLDPWTVMKIAFLLALAAGIMTLVAVAVLWMALDSAGVFHQVGETINSVTSGGQDEGFDLEGYLTLSRVLGFTGIVAALEVVVLTALATLLAFMYNVSSGMVGGVEVTLAEDD